MPQVPRLHLVELEDLSWWPRIVRDLSTDYLHVMEAKFALHRPAVPLLAQALRETGARDLVDLCSGGAGPVPALLADLRAEGLEVRATLTDLYPNRAAFEQATAGAAGAIAFEAESVNATTVPRRLAGFRTMFNAFHHFAPDAATAVLRDAVQAGAPIGIFELPERALRTFLPLLLTPLIVLLATPLIRPFRWSRLFWTYVVPLVPLTCWWDGLVSQLRAYTADELRALGEAASREYTWRAGVAPVGSAPGVLTYLIGTPHPLPGRAGPA